MVIMKNRFPPILFSKYAIMLMLLNSPSNGAVVAHWSFDSDYTDSTGAHNGSLVDSGVANSGIDTSDKKFGAGSLTISSDQSDYVDIANAATLLHDSDGYSMAFWAKKAVHNNDAMVLGNRTDADNFVWLQRNGQLYFRGETQTTSKYSLASDTSWHHIVIVDDGSASNNISVYVDSAATGLVQGTGMDVDGFSINAIGDGWYESGRWAFNGNIDEVWLFDHAVNQQEVTSLFSANAIPEPSSSVLLACALSLSLAYRKRA